MKKELYLGLDVHQEVIITATAQAGREGEVWASGTLSNDLQAVEKWLARQLLQLSAALKEYDSRIARLFASHVDAVIWESFPAPVLLSRLGFALPLAVTVPAIRAPLPSSSIVALYG